MEQSVPGNGNYRQTRLEADLARLETTLDTNQTRIEANQAQLNGKLDALREERSARQLALPEAYVPRREVTERFNNLAQDTSKFQKDVKERPKKLEESMTWAMRLVITGVLTGVAGLLFSLVRAGLKIG